MGVIEDGGGDLVYEHYYYTGAVVSLATIFDLAEVFDMGATAEEFVISDLLGLAEYKLRLGLSIVPQIIQGKYNIIPQIVQGQVTT